MKKKIILGFLLVLLVGIFTGCSSSPSTQVAATSQEETLAEKISPTAGSEEAVTLAPESEIIPDEGEKMMAMDLSSAAFEEGSEIPEKYTCEGADLSPPLSWSGVPEGTKSLALIVDDPDAPAGTWVHWVIFNISPDLTGLAEGASGVGVEGQNDFKKTSYGGPCPPAGSPHRYFFKLYALDTTLDLEEGITAKQLMETIRGQTDHTLGEAELMGTYQR